MRGGAGKSIPVCRQLHLGDDSGPRHTRRRGVDASVRRERAAARQHMRTVQADEPQYGHPYVDQEDEAYEHPDYGQQSNSDDADLIILCKVAKGRDGRFISSGSTSGSTKRSKSVIADNWVVTERLPGGPIDGTMIPSFLGHVASRMWWGEMRGNLKLQSRLSVCTKLREWYNSLSAEIPETQAMIDRTGLSHLQSTMFSHVDTALLSAFVERWQPDTNSFHMPFGEMTIMLHDVWHILRIPVDGSMISTETDTSDLQSACMELMGLTRQELVTSYWAHGGVLTESIFRECGEGRIDETQAIGWLWILLGTTLFVDKSGNRVKASCLHELGLGLEGVQAYSWGSATLAYLYRQLGIASRGDCSGLSGCLTLLQAWIYEYFPCFRPHRDRMIIDGDVPRACTWSVTIQDRSDTRLQSIRARLDQLTASEVTWLPYGSDPASAVPRTIFCGWIAYRDIIEPYMPGRVLRQLGYVQSIPASIHRPMKAIRSWASKFYKVEFPMVMVVDAWAQFPDAYILPVQRYRTASDDVAACDDMYLEWYYNHSHPRLLNIDSPVSTVMPSRSNSEYWVNRLATMYRTCITLLPEETAANEQSRLENFLKDWHSAN